MHLTVREAATLLGQSPRTVRARLLRGDLPGTKTHGRWTVDRRDLPLTERQRRALQQKAEALRRTLDDALPSRLARTPGQRSRSIADLDAFRHGAELLAELQAASSHDRPELHHPIRLLRTALLALSEAVHQYDGELKLAAVRRARTAFARAAGVLLLAAGSPPADPHAAWVVQLETEVLPAVAGLARWAESLARRRPR